MYSEKCDETLKDITVTLPRFNEYSLDPLCDGVDTEDFRYCNKYYDSEIKSMNDILAKMNVKRK